MKASAFFLAAIVATVVSVPAFAGNSDWRHESKPQLPPIKVELNLAKVSTDISSNASSGNNSITSKSGGVQNSIISGNAVACVTSEINVNSLMSGHDTSKGITAKANFADVTTKISSNASSGNNRITSKGTTEKKDYHHSMPSISGGSNYIGTGSAGSEVLSLVNVNKLGL